MINPSELLSLVHPDLRRALDMMGRWALVGGAVRDAAIGKPPRDLDIMVWADGAGMVLGLGDLPDAQWRAYPSRHRVTTVNLTQEMINLDLGVKIHKTDIWSALDPRWSGLPDRWDCFDFSINSAGVWNDGSFSCHEMFFHDIEHKLLRPCRSPVQAYRLEKFAEQGYTLIEQPVEIQPSPSWADMKASFGRAS